MFEYILDVYLSNYLILISDVFNIVFLLNKLLNNFIHYNYIYFEVNIFNLIFEYL